MQRLCVSEHLQLHRQPLEIEEWTVMMMQLLWEFVEYSEVSHSLGDVGKNRCFSYQFGPLSLGNASKDAFTCFHNIHSDR